MIDADIGVGVADAAVLLALADAVIAEDETAIPAARAAVIEAIGEAALVDAAAVIAGFNGITRIADATGIPLEDGKAEQTADWRAELGIDAFQRTKS